MRLFWSLVHRSSWLARRVCDLCREYGTDLHGLDRLEEITTAPRIIGWRCDHLSVMATPQVTLDPPTGFCGCRMTPITEAQMNRTA